MGKMLEKRYLCTRYFCYPGLETQDEKYLILDTVSKVQDTIFLNNINSKKNNQWYSQLIN